jgi:protocatechuate 3,4-dioxygenase beta subunit
MRRSSSLAGLLAACALAFGQSAGAAADDKTASVEGVVTNSITGEPVVRAHVSLRAATNGPQSSQKRFGAVTAAEGKFSIKGVDPGQYSVALDKVGFVMPPENPGISLLASENKSNLKLKLVPVGAITGHVVTAEGDPVEGASVTVEMDSNGNGSSAITDEKGQYRIGGLPPGRYRVRASVQNIPVPPEIRTDGTAEVHYAATYYPSVLQSREATRVETRAGIEAGGTDIHLVRTPIVRVSGTVSGLPPGTPNVRIQARRVNNMTGSGNVKPDGTFEMWKMDPGKYAIMALWNDSTGMHMSSPADIEVGSANIDHVSLNVFPPIDLNVHVEFEDENARPRPPQPPPTQRQGAVQMPQRPVMRRVSFYPIDGFNSFTEDMDENDSFHLSGLMPCRYRVQVSWGPAYVKGMRAGSNQIDGAILDLRNGAAGGTLTLVVSAATGDVSGTVNDEKGPVTRAMIALLQADWDGTGPSASRFAASKPDGTYHIGSIPPGKYRIAAADEADRTLLTRGGNLEDYADVVETIEIHANDKLTKDLKRLKPQ